MTRATHKGALGVEGPCYPIRRLFVDEVAAKIGANTKLKNLITGQKELSLEILGNATLFAETVMIVQEAQLDIIGEWFVTTVDNTFNNNVYLTKIVANCSM